MRCPGRGVNFAGAAVCAALLAYAYYLQYHTGLEPCPLCIFQRVAFFSLGVVFLIAAIHHPAGKAGARVYAVLLSLVALVGVGIASRHIWIQSQPPGTVAACGASLDFMMEILPLKDVIRKVLTGSGECAKVDWRLLGMTMPMWTLAWFAALGLWGVLGNGCRGSKSVTVRVP